MKNIYIALFVLLLAAVPFVFALDPSIYLQTGENPGDIAISEINITNGTYAGVYQWVKIGGEDTFLVNITGDRIVNDSATIGGIVKQYYVESYYPKEAELDAIETALQKANDSRESIVYGQGVESSCRQALVQDLYPCETNAECEMSCMRSYSLCKPAMDSIGPDFVTAAVDFSKDTKDLNIHLNDALVAIEAIGFDNVGTQFPILEKAVSDYNKSAVHLRKNKLRDPISSGEGAAGCPDCYQYCAQVPVGLDAIGNATRAIAALKPRISAIGNFDATVNNFVSNTALRLAHKENLANAAVYTEQYNKVLAKKTELLNRAAKITTKFTSSNLEAKINAVKKNSDDMKTAIDSNNFTKAGEALASFNSASTALSLQLAEIEGKTGEFEQAYAEASRSVVAARWNINENDGRNAKVVELETSFEEIKNAAPYDPAVLENITVELNGIDAEAKALVAEGPTAGVSSFAGTLAKSMVDNSIGIVGKVTPVTYSSKKTIAPLIPPLMIAIADTAILTMMMVGMVLAAVILKKRVLSRSGALKFGAIFIVISLLVVIPSYAAYHFIKQRGGMTTLSDFSADLQAIPTVIILEDDSGPASLKACGKQLKDALESQGKDVTEQLIDADGLCLPDGTSLDECVTDLSAAVFTLKSADTPYAQFFSIYEERAELGGDKAFYDECQIAELIRSEAPADAAATG
ncbi:Uncharacterised protein [Candidatus Gugararchaeum adminiculabundum]|nr:Uncharacterised protein [Candidatus Gugararchaeum adminiculabundum]